jgi:hypothetical protein
MKKILLLSFLFCWIAGSVIGQRTGCISGDCENGKGTYIYEGNGTQIWKNGAYVSYDKFVGNFRNGKRKEGTYTWANGDKFVGRYGSDGHKHFGTLTYANGKTYEGYWAIDNNCTITYSNGDKYVGASSSGAPHTFSGDSYSIGTMTYADGDKTVYGVMYGTTVDNVKKYEGEWRKGKFHGEGTLTCTNGEIVIGLFEDGKLQETMAHYKANIKAKKKDPELFLPKDEFETIAEYEERKRRQVKLIKELEEEEIAKQQEKLAEAKRQNAIKIEKSREKVTFYPSLIGTYNPENETFPLTVNKNLYTVSVPRNEARAFKENYSTAVVDGYKQLKEDAVTYEYFNFVVTHPIKGSKYKIGSQKDVSGVNVAAITSSDKKVIPPKLDMEVIFNDFNNNGFLDAEESGTVTASITNTGKGSAIGVVVKLQASASNDALRFDDSRFIGEIPSGQTKTVELDISATKDVKRIENHFTVSATESYGFPPNDVKLSFETYPFIPPRLELIDYGVSSAVSNKIMPGVVAEVQLRVQNKGQGKAENVTFNINLPQGVYFAQESKQNFTFSTIETGQYKDLYFSCTPNKNVGSVIELTIGYLEKSTSGRFPLKLEVDKPQKSIEQLVIKGKEQKSVIIDEIPDIMVDVDKNIPTSGTTQQHTYALIIGNEDYQSKQTGLSVEQNVPFAENDAKVFKEYCTKSLGVPEKNIRLLLNAGSIEMKQAIEWVNYMSELESGKAKLIVYYTGHGLPDDNDKSHLMPVDVSGLSLKYAVKLSDMYKELYEHPARQITVFLDACFSGGARNQGLLATTKSIRSKPDSDPLQGNMVVFASSSGDETSLAYEEKRHGFFTYFLLKKLQQTGGDVDLKELGESIYNSVRLEAGHIGKKQTPQVNASSAAADKWEGWKLR